VDGHLLLDPTIDEANREDGSALLAMMPSANAVRISGLISLLFSEQIRSVLQMWCTLFINKETATM